MTTMIRERAVFTELNFGMAWKAEQAISHALQPAHFFVSTFISFTILVFFSLVSTMALLLLVLIFLGSCIVKGSNFIPGQNAPLDEIFRHVAQI